LTFGVPGGLLSKEHLPLCCTSLFDEDGTTMMMVMMMVMGIMAINDRTT